MSLPGSASGPAATVPPQKRGFSVYSMMLVISFIALVTGSVLLYYELDKYGRFPQWDTSEMNKPPQAPAAGS